VIDTNSSLPFRSRFSLKRHRKPLMTLASAWISGSRWQSIPQGKQERPMRPRGNVEDSSSMPRESSVERSDPARERRNPIAGFDRDARSADWDVLLRMQGKTASTNVPQKAGLNRGLANAGFGGIRRQLEYKSY
jgi:hypothetical protein